MNILKILTPQRQTGNLGERAALKLLRLKGYRILEKNYTANGAEIDVIAKRLGITAFVEVKARNIKSLGQYQSRPAAAVTPEKQRKIIRVAEHYARRRNLKTRMRFDVVEIYLEDTPRGVKIKDKKHLEGAFDKNTAYKGYIPKGK